MITSDEQISRLSLNLKALLCEVLQMNFQGKRVEKNNQTQRLQIRRILLKKGLLV